jgi:hypothetical protein
MNISDILIKLNLDICRITDRFFLKVRSLGLHPYRHKLFNFCTEFMGIDPNNMKYLEWCSCAGMWHFDISDIDVDCPDYSEYIRTYKLNDNFEEQIAWLQTESLE